jgi:hypothetical protein
VTVLLFRVAATVIAVVIGVTVGLNQVTKHGGAPLATRPLTAARVAASEPASMSFDRHCADLLVETQVQFAVVDGVWACLEPGVQALFRGTGDAAVSGFGYFTGYTFIGRDGSVCVYSLRFEATTAGTTGISETTMTVWLDDRGLVAHAAIPKAIP